MSQPQAAQSVAPGAKALAGQAAHAVEHMESKPCSQCGATMLYDEGEPWEGPSWGCTGCGHSLASKKSEAKAEAPPARSAGGAPAVAHPPPVTRGESAEAGAVPKAKLDWLNATFAAPPCSLEAFIAQLAKLFRRPISALEAGGRLGFERRIDLQARVGSRAVVIGCIAYGGASQQGRWLLQFTGVGCQFVPDWSELRDMLEQLDARLTRVDLAVDLLHGEYTVDDAVNWHVAGGFTSRGRCPSTSLAGDWLDGMKGRTFYVGNAANGKVLRVYEKGKQLGDSASDWVRFEVQFGNRDRVIPFDALTDPDRFFAGAYPALQEVLQGACEQIETEQTGGSVTLGHLLYHLRRCYGKVVDVLCSDANASSSALVEEVRVIGLPRRLNPSSVEAGVSWADVQARLRSYL